MSDVARVPLDGLPLDPAEDGPSHADVCERLLMEFGPTLGLRLVSEVLRHCRTELAACPPSDLTESLDALARVRLAAVPVAMRHSQAS